MSIVTPSSEKGSSPKETHSAVERKYAVKTNFILDFSSALSLSLSFSSFFLGGAMLTVGQSSRLAFISTFFSGTYFLVNAMEHAHPTKSYSERCFHDLTAAFLFNMVSLRQFMQHRRLKWAGYSSWGSFAATSILALRWIWASNV